MVMNDIQKEQMREEGWLVNPSAEEIWIEEARIADLNQWKDPGNANGDLEFARYYHDDRFEDRAEFIDSQKYTGYALFQRVMKYVFKFHFPEYADISEEEAREKRIYPTFAWRNHGGRMEWAKSHNGHIAELDENYKGELRDIWNAARQAVIDMWKYGGNPSNEIVLGYLGIALLGWRGAFDAKVYGLGVMAELGSGSLDGLGDVRSLGARRDEAGADDDWLWQRGAVSSVVVSDI